ncbi:MAG: PAS domain S-box protein [Conexivisphaerales archaeon]
MQSIPGLSDDVSSLLSKLPFPVWHAAQDGSRDFFNDAWLEFTGRVFEEELHLGWVADIHRDDRDSYMKVYKDSLASSKPYTIEFRLRHSDGSFRNVTETAFPFPTADRLSIGFIGTIHDTTKARRYEQEISSYAIREKFLKDSIPEALVTLDLSGNVIGWNNGAEKLFGYEQTEAIGRNFRRFIPERHHQIFKTRMTELGERIDSETRVSGSLEAKALKRDGSESYVLITYVGTKTEDGGQLMLLVKDITEEKMKLRKLLREQERLKSIVDSSSVGVALVGLDGRIIYANRSFSDLLDYQQDRLKSVHVADITHPDDRNLMVQYISSMSSLNPSHIKTEARFIRASGGAVWAATTIDPYLGEDGRAIYFVLELVDITDIKRMEQELSEQIKELRMEIEKKSKELESAKQVTPEAEKLISIGMSLAQVTHDIRNPLTAIDLGLYALENSLPEKDRDTEKIITTMRNALKQANDIVTELTQFVKPTPPKKSKVVLKEVINDTLSTMTIPQKIRRQVEVSDDAVIYGDELQMARVIQNLVKNAVEAMPDGGVLKISADRKGDSVILNVSDTGKGMSKEVQENLFSPFFTTKEKGLGLGLAIIKKFVTDQGGQIDVESEEGKGTRFRITFPAYK